MSSLNKRLPLMVAEADLKRWKARAASQGLSVSEFVRSAANLAAIKASGPEDAVLDLIERLIPMGPNQRHALAIAAMARAEKVAPTPNAVASRAPRSSRKKP